MILQYGSCLQLNLINLKKLKNRIKKNEGYRSKAYLDSLGFKTIGYGHLIKSTEKNLLKKKFSKNFLNDLFNSDLNKALRDFKMNYKRYKISDEKKEIIIEMIFQLGIKNQKKFVKMNKHIKNNSNFMAALEMKNSLWYKQTPKRVDALIKLLLKKNYE